LVGDIGGTKTSLGIFEPGEKRPRLKILEIFPSREAKNLEEIIDLFLEKHPVRISHACFGIAGPVEKGRAKTTNLPWKVREASIEKRFKWGSVRLINDLAATALAIPLLTNHETLSLNRGKKAGQGNIGLVAPGTGLGMAFLMKTDHGYIPLASEGGHADFSPNNEREVALWRHLRSRFGHVSAERVLSGPGLVHIYTWLRDSGAYREPLWLKKKKGHKDPARTITEAASARRTPLAVAALKMFVSILGSVAGNLALIGMTTGGMFLGGGIPPKILPHLEPSAFMAAFLDKGRFRPFLERMPVKIILNDRAALLGAAHCALSG